MDKQSTGYPLYELLPEEICAFALTFPKIGYRKLTWMMVYAGTVCVGESTVYRVLRAADLLSRWKRSAASSGEYHFRPVAPNQQWHTDVMYVWVAARFYFLVSFVDAYRRYVVHHKQLINLNGQAASSYVDQIAAQPDFTGGYRFWELSKILQRVIGEIVQENQLSRTICNAQK